MLKKNTAGQVITFCMVKAIDGSALTGATVSAWATIDDGAQAAAGGSVTEKGRGQYRFAPSQADTNGDFVGYLFTAANGVPVNVHVRTTAADLANGDNLGLADLASVKNTLAAAGTTVSVAGVTPDEGGNYSFVVGDDYYAADGRGVSWSSTSSADLGAAAVNMYIYDGLSQHATLAHTLAAAVTGSAGAWVISVDVPASVTSLLTGTRQRYELVAVLANGHEITLVSGGFVTGVE